MANKMIALALAGLLLSGFSWGKTEQSSDHSTSTATPKSTYSSASNTASPSRATTYAQAQTNSGQYNTGQTAKKSGKKSSFTSETAAAPEPAASVAPSGAFPTALLNSLASGSEAERKARIDSLKRLSQAMSKMGAQKKTTTAETAAVS